MPDDCSYNELFALQVTDNSMEPEFPSQCIVVIEPSKVCGNGAYVFIEVEGVRWFRQFLRDECGNPRLVALNDLYPDIELDGIEHEILGVIVQRNIRRKVKHYHPMAEQALSG